MNFEITSDEIKLSSVKEFLFKEGRENTISFSKDVKKRVDASNENFKRWVERKVPIYGVTTGFGESCYRTISSEFACQLQDNLISYLMIGTGQFLNQEVGKFILFFRTISLSRGYSGVSFDMLQKMQELFNKGIYPVIPREGSLGASGDLIPLAYLANNIRGKGKAYYNNTICEMEDLVSKGLYEAYDLQAKEGLALVNGTTAMEGLSFYNYRRAKFLTQLSALCSSWLCLTVNGRNEAFGKLVNEKTKTFYGQSYIAQLITKYIDEEDYKGVSYDQISTKEGITNHFVQDPYSLRCSPQVVGPIWETLDQIESWIETEMNGVSDNPLFDQEDGLANGGNFYGGYLAHSMDYLKICMGNLADLMDRQLALLISDKTNRGLTPNLTNWEGMSEEERHLHHGLKGVHQNVSAITSEIMAKCIPNSIFSRSSESHNQDKVSLGMSAATQCHDQLEVVFTVFACYLTCLAQAIDLRKIKLKGEVSLEIYNLVRKHVPMIKFDRALDNDITNLRKELMKMANEKGGIDV